MKKLTSMYKRYMFHPILYKTVTRTSIVAVLMLLWQRYVSDAAGWRDHPPSAGGIQGDGQAAEKDPLHPFHHRLCG